MEYTDKPWLQSYPEGIDHEINPDCYNSLVDLFEQACEEFEGRPSFTNMGTTITFKELEERSRAFAAYLQEHLFLKPGDKIALMMPNLLQYPIAMFGALRAGLTVVNVNPLYTPRELEFQLKDSGATTIVILENFAHVLEKVIKKTQIKFVITTQIGDLLKAPKSYIVNFVVKYIKKMVPKWSLPGSIQFKRTLEIGLNSKYIRPHLKGSDIAYLQYTGGTTGSAKGAILTHRNMVANLSQASEWIKLGVTRGEEIIVTALPLYHIFSLTANCLTFMRIGALNVLITNPRDIPNFIKELNNFKFTAITGVNTLFNALLNNPKFKDVDFSAMHLALGGGMAVQEAVAKRWQEVTKAPLLEAYGLTETAPAACINPVDLDAYNGSIGLPLSSTEISIRDDDNQLVPVGEPGELCIKGPQVTPGYWQHPEETKNAFTDDGYFKTGDIAKMDEKGFVYLVDRKKDMILVSGFNVYPNEVEAVIIQMPGVLEVGVVGVPNQECGEQVKAFVVKKDPTLTEEAIMAHCKEQLTAYKRPKVIVFLDDLPKTNVGKILRRALKE